MSSYVCAETMALYGYTDDTGAGMISGLSQDRFAATDSSAQTKSVPAQQ